MRDEKNVGARVLLQFGADARQFATRVIRSLSGMRPRHLPAPPGRLDEIEDRLAEIERRLEAIERRLPPEPQ